MIILLHFTMGKGNSSTQVIETTARESSHRPRGRVRRFLEKVKDGANKLKSVSPRACVISVLEYNQHCIERSNDSRSRSLAPPNACHDEYASSTLNIEAGSHTRHPVSALSEFW
ncbi:hypothetical protein BDR04DRAFT_719073 [Suillus decipiens]|nr:hypothetical protein BDR04DRAFT_719073 [Suillus decipiens]